ncbi:50S ribosomal protein L21e [Candidatus Woesearchaeota archaeon]|nr:MAG: 50S ribosomal protein L21e [Candidatus Woesearchaeota archaeon]
MARRKGGARSRTRRVFRKHPRTKGKVSMTRYFMPFKEGDKVLLKAEPAIQASLYHQRFHSKMGIVAGQRGKCYEVKIADGRKPKLLIVHPVHLKKV